MNLHGLRLDGKFDDSALNTWGHARNILLSRGFDSIENEPGDTLVTSSIGGTIIGRVTTPNDILFFTYNSGYSYIRHLSSTGTLTTIMTISQSIYNFNPSVYPNIYIEGVHCYNNDSELIVAFTTGHHKPLILNVTELLLSAPNTTITTDAGLKDYYLFPEFDHNTFSLGSTAIVNGGRLPVAAYFFSLSYELEPGVDTNFGGISSPVFITDDDALTIYKQFRGSGSLVITNKGIVVTVNGADTSRSYFKLVIIQKTESGTNCFITKRIKSLVTGTNVFIDDLSKLAPFSLTEVVTSSPAYTKVTSITQSNRKLRLYGLEKPDKIALADIYNDVMPSLTVNWVNERTVALNQTKNSYKDSVFIFNYRTFRTDEVYALYLGLKLKTGGYYGIYHIPGRAKIGTEDTDHTILVDGVHTIDDYKLTSSATKDGNYYGKMGFWENENEVYPTGYGTLTGAKVRHHRFPSAGQLASWKSGLVHTSPTGTLLQTIEFITDDYSGGGSLYYGATTPVIGPSLGTFLPANISGDNTNQYVAKYTQVIDINFDYNMIVEANGSGTMTVMKYVLKTDGTYTATTLHTDTQTDGGSGSTLKFVHTEAGISLNAGDYISVYLEMNTTSVTMWGIANGDTSPYIKVYEATQGQEILGLQITLDWNYILGNHAATAATLLESVDGFEIFYAKRTLSNQLMIDQSIAIQEGAGYRFYGFDSMANLLNIEPTHVKSQFKLEASDYTTGLYVNEVLDYTAETAQYSAVTKTKYLPAYNSATIPSNENKENCYYFEATSGSFDKRLVNLISIKDDVYLDFSNQELVSTGVVKPLAHTSAFSLYGGDTYVGHNSVLTFPTGVITEPKVWYFPIESILNSGMRYEGDNEYEKVYPLTDITQKVNVDGSLVQSFILSMFAAGIANYYFYNNDYHLLNTFRQDTIDNELTSRITKYPNRIQSSITQPLEASSIYWKKFKILDYFDMQNNKGAIYKAISTDKIVYIQTQYSIFRGTIIDRLTTGEIDVALKTSEMFDRPLDELLDTDGVYIKPWNREGTILTPYGLVTVDLDRGAIYVISDKNDEITKLGIEDWFRNTVKNVISLPTVKETIGTGVALGYDDIYKRLLVTIRNGNISTSNVNATGLSVIVTTTLPHSLPSGTFVTMSGCMDEPAINGTYQITNTGANTFEYSAPNNGTGTVSDGTLKTIADFTLSFQFEKMLWVSFHSYTPDKYIWNGNGLYSLSGTSLYKKFVGKFGYIGTSYYPSTIDWIFNNNRGERFLLKNVAWTTNVEQTGINVWNDTIDNLLIYSKNLCSNWITIVKRAYDYDSGTHAMVEVGNALYQDGKWIYDDIADYLTTPNSAFLDGNYNLLTSALNLSKNYFEKSKFITTFILVRMSFTNDSSNKKLRISNVAIDVKNIL